MTYPELCVAFLRRMIAQDEMSDAELQAIVDQRSVKCAGTLT